MKTLLPLLLAVFVMAGTAFATPPYYAPGSYQGWDIGTAPELVDDGTNGDAASGDGVYSRLVTIATAGAYEWKAAEGGWAASWPGSGNCWFITTSDNEEVLFTFDTVAHGDGWGPDSYWPHSSATRGATYTLVGSLGDELGGSDWDPAGPLVMHDDGMNGDPIAGDGHYTFCGSVSTAGLHEWKVVVNGGWAQQFGTDGPGVNSSTWLVDVLNDGDFYCFVLDTNLGRIRTGDLAIPVRDASWGTIKNLYK
jgi:hypothetical protein